MAAGFGAHVSLPVVEIVIAVFLLWTLVLWLRDRRN